MHEASCFATLTYEDNPQFLQPRDFTLWLKRLRKRVGPFRYYGVGEYGEETWRPHYHAALFGVPITAYEEVKETWGKGIVHLGELNESSAAYITGYVTKKLNRADAMDWAGKPGFEPEFARMSRRPGIGVLAAANIGESLLSAAGARLIASTQDVPVALRQGGKFRPLGRTMRRHLRHEVLGDPNAPVPYEARRASEVQALSADVGVAEAVASLKLGPEVERIRQLEVRTKIWTSRRTI